MLEKPYPAVRQPGNSGGLARRGAKSQLNWEAMTNRILILAAVILTAIGSASAGKSPSAKRKKAAVPAAANNPSPIAGRIAYIGEAGNLYVCGAACAKPVCITCASRAEQALADGVVPVLNTGPQPQAAPAASYDLPTFSPDGEQIAYSSAQRSRGGYSFAVNVYDFSRRPPISIFQSPEHPIYLYWLPDGRRIFFLAENENSLDLILAEVRENRPVRVLLNGLPLFFAWNQAASDLAFHYVPPEDAGPEQSGLMEVKAASQRVVKVLSRGASPFRTPAWSPDGSHLAYVIDNQRGEFVLTVANADGSAPKPTVGLAPGTTAFVWSPDSKSIAFSTLKKESKMSYDGINLLDLASGNVTPLVSDSVIAYSFSPNGKWLAYIGTSETANSWNVIAPGGGKPRKLCNFVASSAESAVYRVFDQYALSHRVWSPDSRAIVFAGGILKQGQAPGANVSPSVWVLPVDGDAPRSIADGSVAFWSPR
jgi:TolB protein